MLNRSASLAMSTSVLKALPGKLDTKDTHRVFSIYKYPVPEGNVSNQGIGHLQQNNCVIRVYDDHLPCSLIIINQK